MHSTHVSITDGYYMPGFWNRGLKTVVHIGSWDTALLVHIVLWHTHWSVSVHIWWYCLTGEWNRTSLIWTPWGNRRKCPVGEMSWYLRLVSTDMTAKGALSGLIGWVLCLCNNTAGLWILWIKGPTAEHFHTSNAYFCTIIIHFVVAITCSVATLQLKKWSHSHACGCTL